jgi:hypothetical protein
MFHTNLVKSVIYTYVSLAIIFITARMSAERIF